MQPRRALITLLVACGCAAGLTLSMPLPAGAGITPNEAKAWHPDLDAATRFAKSRSTEVSFAIYDMRNRLSAREGERAYIMASTFKVMLLVAYLRQVAGRDLTQDERDLLVPMIRESDNAAATRVRDILGPGPIHRLADDADMTGFAWSASWGLSRATPRDGARLMRRLRGLLPERHRGFALRQLESIIPRHRWGVAHVEPKGWDLAFKGGWGLRDYRVEHQVALLRNGKRRIGVSVLTQGNPSRRYGRVTLEGVFRILLRDLPR